MLKKIAIIIVAIVVFITVTGSIVEFIIRSIEKKNGIFTGKLIEINGEKMHVFSEGNGKNTVVLVAGLGTASPYVNFQPLWSRLSKDNRVVVVERFGYGISELSRNERTFENIVKEMKDSLDLSGQKPPYTLVGHSMGGSICIAYAQAYPDEVENIIMLDAPVPQSYKNWDRPKDKLERIIPVLRNTGYLRALTLNKGVMEAVRLDSNGYKEVPEKFWDMDKSLTIKNLYNYNVKFESKLLKSNIEYITEKEYPYNIPTLFISTNYLYELMQDSKKMQTEYIENAAQSKLIELDGRHYIHQYYPQEISDEINDFIK